MMWSTSYVAWRVLGFLAAVHTYIDSQILRIGLWKSIGLSILFGGSLLWLHAPVSSPFVIFCVFLGLMMARDAIRRPEGFRPFGIFETDEAEERQSLRFAVVGSAPLLGYIAFGLLNTYWFASGEAS
ncbi:hypothetical protein So717_08330 [Roseobacter cerasinus]|uniref:Uncharacterized protein n=1 Tax=Roseobacter cerasinus TaxID=2602289 RepID=A0A640VNS7_9RHOB|nr:hypothetical protein [Roseobacter cerasinus]GFE49080.1 hypothetical protein So717_08330 [Roseobacter cerasinus]